MKITDMKSTIVSVQFGPPGFWPWAWGVAKGYTAVIIEVMTDEGIVGIGESSCVHPSAEITKQIVDSMKPFVVGEDPHNIERIVKKLYGMAGWIYFQYTGNRAMSGLEMALWDIIGKASDKPLYQLIGGCFRDRIRFQAIIRRQEPEAEAAEAKKFKDQGWKDFYIKIGIDPVKDMEEVELVRGTIGYDVNLVADVNQMWSVGTAIRNIRKLEKYDLSYVEQPVPGSNLEGMALLRQKSSIPIAAHEAAFTLYEAFNVIKKEAADVLIVDPGYMLISGLKKVAGAAELSGMPVVGHCPAGELGIREAAVLHCIASTPNFLYGNQTMYWYMADDVIKRRFEFKDGCLELPKKPGLGVELDADKVRKYHENYREIGSFGSEIGSFAPFEETAKQTVQTLPPRF